MKLPFRQFHILQILKNYSKQTIPLDVFLSNYFRSNKSLGSKDRKSIADNIYDLVRWKGLIDHLCQKPITWQKRLEKHQNFDYRKYIEDPSIPSNVKVSFPKDYFEKIQKDYGDDQAKDICYISNNQAPTTIRANLVKITRDELYNLFKDKYNISKTPQSEHGIIFHKKINFFGTQEFKDGLFEIQDEGSQIIASHIDVKPKDQILDYCAGSGGKTLAFAHKMKGQGQIYLTDIRDHILTEAKKRMKRAGIEHAQIKLLNSSNLKKLKNKMDTVVLDVPCSGSGTLRRNMDMKWKFHNDMIENLVKTQRDIFDKALIYLKNKGQIIYITCSIFKDENEKQIDYFIKKYNLFLENSISWLPKKDSMDGFFLAVLKKQ